MHGGVSVRPDRYLQIPQSFKVYHQLIPHPRHDRHPFATLIPPLRLSPGGSFILLFILRPELLSGQIVLVYLALLATIFRGDDSRSVGDTVAPILRIPLSFWYPLVIDKLRDERGLYPNLPGELANVP